MAKKVKLDSTQENEVFPEGGDGATAPATTPTGRLRSNVLVSKTIAELFEKLGPDASVLIGRKDYLAQISKARLAAIAAEEGL